MYFFPSIYIDSSIEYTINRSKLTPLHRKHKHTETVSRKARIPDPPSRDPPLTTNHIFIFILLSTPRDYKFIAFKRTTNIIVLPKSVPSLQLQQDPLLRKHSPKWAVVHNTTTNTRADNTEFSTVFFFGATSRSDYRRRPLNILRLRIACPGQHPRSTTTTQMMRLDVGNSACPLAPNPFSSYSTAPSNSSAPRWAPYFDSPARPPDSLGTWCTPSSSGDTRALPPGSSATGSRASATDPPAPPVRSALQVEERRDFN